MPTTGVASKNTMRPFFATCIFLLSIVIAGTASKAEESHERQARGLYVKAAKIIRSAGCQRFENMFVQSGVLEWLAVAFFDIPSKNSLKKCLAAYEGAASIYDRILNDFEDTKIAVQVVQEGRLGSKGFKTLKQQLTASMSALSDSRASALRNGDSNAERGAFGRLLNAVRPTTNPDTARPLDQQSGLQRRAVEEELTRLVRKQIIPCWNIPASAKDVHDMKIALRIRLNRDGSIIGAPQLIDSPRTDPFYRAVAESARRALQNPQCQPLNLPPQLYEIWKVITFNFDPSEALGP